MKLDKVSIFIISIITLFKVTILLILWKIYNLHNLTVEVQENRLKSIEIVNKYKSDILQLNQFVKSYIATANPKYLIYYYDLLAINDGSKSEPINYSSLAYWPSVISGDIEHRMIENKKGISLISKMQEQGFSQDELDQLNMIHIISEKIKEIEQIAFAATQGLFDNKTLEFVDDGEPNLEYASSLVYGQEYIKLASELYKATDNLINKTKQRTQTIVDEKEKNLREWIYLLIFFVLINTSIILILFPTIKKYLLMPVSQLTKATEEVSNKNYDLNIAHKNWLYEFKLLAKTFNDMAKNIKDDIKIREQNRLEIQNAKQLLEESFRKTKDSIEYASLIQKTLIPENSEFDKFFKDYFIIWNPKDVVGGDIYFYQELRHKNESLLMVIDCTGHGVPGAFVTLLVKAIERNIISYILNNNEEVSPAKILSIFNKSIKHLMKQDHTESISSAGFDGQILYFNKNQNIVKFASAKNELLYSYNHNEVEMIKGDRHSVGYKDSNLNYEFTEHTLEIKDNLTLYLSSDGYWDQLGGEKDRSFGKKRFKNLIDEIKHKKMIEQKDILTTTLNEYQGDYPRQDDITIVALKL